MINRCIETKALAAEAVEGMMSWYRTLSWFRTGERPLAPTRFACMGSRRILIFLLPVLALAAAAAPPQPSAKPNVVLITIDTLRADYLGSYGNLQIKTPVLDALANEGTLFERAYCQAPMTPPSHASILTGTYPPVHGVRDFTSTGLRAGFPTLAGILKKNGYNTAAFVSAYVLDSVWGLNQGFDFYYDRFSPREFEGQNPGNVQRKAGETIGAVLDWLKSGPRQPYFLWVHLFDPHHDYNPPEPFRTHYAKDLYGGEVAYTDSEIGRLVDALKSRGDYENTLFVVTSDHGEAFGEHDESGHGFFLYDITTRVPLIFKLPKRFGATTRRVRGSAETVDIAPTLLQATQTPPGPGVAMNGRGLLSQILGKSGPQTAACYAETLYPRNTFGWSELAFYLEGKYKYIDAPKPELYDVAADPEEKVNLYSRQRAMADVLRQKLEQFRQRFRSATGGGPAAADPQRIEALRALGYVAVSVPVQRNPGQPGLIDPKDRVQVFNKILLALQASDAGALPKSNAFFTEVVQEDPSLFIAHYSLGVNRLKAGENAKALEHFERANSLNPSFDLTNLNRATALGRLGRIDEAVVLLEGVLRQSPSRVATRKQLATLYSRKKDYPKAIAIYRDILATRPQDADATKFLGITQVESEAYEQGAATLKKAIALGAADALAHNFLGIALGNLGRPGEAVEAYRQALTIKSDYHQARLNLSFALVKAGQQEAAARNSRSSARRIRGSVNSIGNTSSRIGSTKENHEC